MADNRSVVIVFFHVLPPLAKPYGAVRYRGALPRIHVGSLGSKRSVSSETVCIVRL